MCTLDEALASELTAQEEMIFEADSDLGKIKYVGAPVKFSDEEVNLRFRAPKLGEHTEEILHSLGYSNEKINELRTEGSI